MSEAAKVTLARKRAELVARLATPLSAADRVRLQGELSVINAKIKALNTTEAAQLKAAADQRKIAGLAEAQANAQRALSRAHAKQGIPPPIDATDAEDAAAPDPGTEVDGWIDAVLLRHDVTFIRSAAGKLEILDPTSPEALVAALGTAVEGIRAVAFGQPLPELPASPPPKPAPPEGSARVPLHPFQSGAKPATKKKRT